MKMTTKLPHTFKPLLLVSAIAALSACGGGGGGSSAGSTPVTAKGVVTQIGSAEVNGVLYNTDNSSNKIDDNPSASDSLIKKGMVLYLKGNRNDDGVSGSATEIEYENEIEGTWNNTTGTINGITIIITTDGTNIEGWNGSAEVPLEVSGLWLDDTTLEATFIKLDDESDGTDELKGPVTAVNSSTEFVMRGFTITHSSGLTLSEGDIVEVHLNSIDVGAKTAVAVAGVTGVELEDNFFSGNDDGAEIEFEGIVSIDPTKLTNLCPTGADMILDDEICVDWDSAEFDDGLVDETDVLENSRVEIEGVYDLSGFLFIADEVKGRGNRVRIETDDYANASGSSIELFAGTSQVTVDLSIADLDGYTSPTSTETGYRMEGILTGVNTVMATKIEDRDVKVGEDSLRGQILSPTATPGSGGSFTIAGVTVTAATEASGNFEEIEVDDVAICDDDSLTPALPCTQTDIDAFFSGLVAGDEVEAEGSYTAGTHTITATKLERELEDD